MRIFWVRLLRIFLLPLCLVGFGWAKADEANEGVYGKWRVIKDLTPEGSITSKSEQQIRAVIGKTAAIGPDKFAFNGSECRRPEYKRSVDDTVEYFYREWRVSSSDFPLGDRVTVVDVTCDHYLIYPIDKNRLIIAMDGVFFEAVRLGAAAGGGTASAMRAKADSGVNADIFGAWTIDGVTWEKGRVLTQKQAKMLMGMPVYIDAGRFVYYEHVCDRPSYKRSQETKSAYFRGDWRSDFARLPLPDKLTAVATECGTIYPVSRKRILIEDNNGLFFSAVPLQGNEAR
ncbi:MULTISPECIES: hypothetical protein [unclassified Massilia]|uniref:hypothetical protein n=1 Tax=unclassified Massilia TaxID=2609279 RepID=UPI001B82A73C|nr:MULTISPECIES: hypothetical protein [unclassified Massilia]MBQ5939957.1 hypothetical protein [Massilia sp. AB1]MBQ5964286.1 hypothetical protein [Massilia sp. ZL223]